MTVSSGFSAEADLRVAGYGPGVRVVRVSGQIDGPSGLELADSLAAQLAVAQVVIVDLDNVELLGSPGLSALFEANELAAHQGRALRLVCHSRIALRALETAGLRECFTFADSVPDALRNSLGMTDVIGSRSRPREGTRGYQKRRTTKVSRTAASARVIRSGRS